MPELRAPPQVGGTCQTRTAQVTKHLRPSACMSMFTDEGMNMLSRLRNTPFLEHVQLQLTVNTNVADHLYVVSRSLLVAMAQAQSKARPERWNVHAIS